MSSDDDTLGFFTRPAPASLLEETTARSKRGSSDASARRPIAARSGASRTPSVDLTGLDSDDDDGDDAVAVRAKGKGKARAAAVALLDSPSSDEDEDETIPIDSPYTLDALVGVPRRSSSSLRKTVLRRVEDDFDLPPPLDFGRPKPAPTPIVEDETDELESPPRQRQPSATTTDSEDRPILETIARRQQRKAEQAGPSQRRCDQCGNMLDVADYDLHIELHQDAEAGAFDVDPDEIEAIESPPAQARKAVAAAAPRVGLAERRERDHAQLANDLRLREVPRKRPAAAASIVLDDDDDDEPVIVAPAAKRPRAFVPAAAKPAPRAAPAAPAAGPSRPKPAPAARPNAAGPFAAMAAQRGPAARRQGPIEIDDDDDDDLLLDGGADGYVSDTAPGTLFVDRISESAREHYMSAAGLGDGADPEASRDEWDQVLQRQRDPPKAAKAPGKSWGGAWRGGRGGRARGRGGGRGRGARRK